MRLRLPRVLLVEHSFPHFSIKFSVLMWHFHAFSVGVLDSPSTLLSGRRKTNRHNSFL